MRAPRLATDAGLTRALVVLLLLACLSKGAHAEETALLVVGAQNVHATEERIVASLQARRRAAGLTAQQLPILVYHTDNPSERKYCEGRLGIRPADVVYVGLARLAGDRLPGEVIDGRGHVTDAAAAAPYADRALAVLGRPQAQVGGPVDVQAAYTAASAAGDRAMLAHDYETAASRYAEAAGLQPDQWRASAGQASALIALSRWDGALTAATRAADIAPVESLPHALMGLALAGAGSADRARPELMQAIALSPQWAVPHAWLARFDLSRREVESARIEAALAVDLDPRQPIAHYVLGTTSLLGWRLEEAAGHLRSAVTFEPSWASAYDLLGWTYVLGGRYALAEAAYQKLMPLDAASASLGMALSRHTAGDDGDALRWIEKAQTLRPKDATILSVHAFVLATLGRADEAHKIAQAAVVADTKNPNAWEALGDAQTARGKPQGALEDYARAEEMLRGWPEPELYYRWALAAEAAGHRNDAIALVRRLLQRYPGSAYTERAQTLTRRWER